MILGERYDARGVRGCERENKYSAAILRLVLNYYYLIGIHHKL